MKLINFWYSKATFLNWILYPFELLYLLVVFFRKAFYRYNIIKTHRFHVPVIVVGNITVGGTGKTPMVIYIANYLKKNGFHPAVVSRGYKSKKAKLTSIVPKNADPILFGDEPVLIANSIDCPIAIGIKRSAAVSLLLNTFNDIDVIISDDGLQHYSLYRNLEIVVVDGERLFGNKHCLPCGPLREPIGRLSTVDLIILNQPEDLNFKKQDKQLHINQYTINLMSEKIYNLIKPEITENYSYFKKFPYVHAVAAIGNNQRFFNALNKIGIKTINHHFIDHYQYKEQDLCFNDNIPIIMTPKDAVKCCKFAKDNFWVQQVKVKLNLEEEFNNYLDDFLSKLIIKNQVK